MSDEINNISFTYEDYGIEFSFASETEFTAATLQLPDTGDSVHYVDDDEYDCDNEKHVEIVKQLTDFYFNDFGDDGELGAASAKVGKEVYKVQKVSFVNIDLYVAFTKEQSYVLKESRYRSHYNKRYLFDDPDPEDFEVIENVGEDAFATHKYKVIEMAKREFQEALSNWCSYTMRKYFDTVIKREDSPQFSDSEIAQSFDDLLHDFMVDNFGSDYLKIRFAYNWYSMFGCDIREDFKLESIAYTAGELL